MISNSFFKRFSISLLLFWLVVFALLPFAIVLFASFVKPGVSSFLSVHFTLNNYQTILTSEYLTVFIRSLWLAFLTSFICLLLAYPFSYILLKLPERLQVILLFLLIIPFWTSSLIRVYAIIIIIRAQGLLNSLLLSIGIIHAPIHLLYSQTAVLIGLVYSLLPFMIFPLYANLGRFDWRLLDAAKDLGASRFRVLFQILIPNTIPGIVGGLLLVLLPAMTLFYIPDILGGAKSLLLGNLIKDQFIIGHNWPLGSAVSIVLSILMALMLVFYWQVSDEKDRRQLV